MVWSAWVVVASSCAPAPEPEPPRLLSTSLDGAPDPVSPTPTLRLRFSALVDEDSLDRGAVALIEGLADESWVRALGRGDPTALNAPGLLPLAVSADADAIEAQPLRALSPDTLHTLVVSTSLRLGGLSLARPATIEFTTGPAGLAAATCTLLAPAAGATGVVRNLRSVTVAFSRPVREVDQASLQLVGPGGPVAASVGGMPCPDPGSAGPCFMITPRHPLAADAQHRILLGAAIRDDQGAPPFALAPPQSFATGETIRTQPAVLVGYTAIASSGCLVVVARSDRPTGLELCVGAGACHADSSSDSLHELSVPLAAGGTDGWTLAWSDESTAPPGQLGPVPAPASSPRTLTITEILSHPEGPRLGQQFVEIWNRGAAPVATGGLELHDEVGFNLVPDGVLAPGARALIVPADFALDDGMDVPAVPGTLLLRVPDSHLGGNGIRETGEQIELVEHDGRKVSRFSTYGVASLPGQSARRVRACDVADAVEPTPGGATPGGP